jgi:Arc-like DNA binding domain
MAGRRGRPPKPIEDRKSAHAGVRLPAALYERLAAAARENNRSLSQEMEARLRLSFEEGQKRFEEFGGSTNYWLFRSIASQIHNVERLAYPTEQDEHRRWWQDPYTFKQVKTLINTFCDFFKPNGRAVTPSYYAKDAPLGEWLAEKEMENIEFALMAGNRLDGYHHDPEHPPVGGLPPPGTLTSPWPRAAEWFAAAGPLVPKLTKSPLKKKYGLERRLKT